MQAQELNLGSLDGNKNIVTINNYPTEFSINGTPVSEKTFNLTAFDNLKATEKELAKQIELNTDLRKEIARLKKIIKVLALNQP